MQGRYLRVARWSEFQHYKDRNPPWIKLHRTLLSDYEFSQLPDATKGHLTLIWLLASETENQIPNDAAWIARKIGANSKVDLDTMIGAGFLEPATGKAESPGWGSRYITRPTKEAVWARDKGKCTKCGSRESVEYDHIVPVSAGGSSEVDNLQLLCRPCNRAKRLQTVRYADAELSAPHIENKSPQLAVSEAEAEAEAEAETETETETETCPAVDEEPSKSQLKAEVQAVFDHYCRVMGRNPTRYTLTEARRKKILARLKDNEPDRLTDAIDACRASPFHMGENDRGTLYNDLVDNILKSEEQMEKWLNQPSRKGLFNGS